MSPNLKGFLDNLDSLHYFIDHVVYKANLRGPSFRCEDNPDGTITLHYYTGRPGLYPIVKGVLREAAKRVFKLDVSMSITAMPLHDATRDLILLNQQRLSDVEMNLQLEANNEQLENLAKDLEVEKGKTDALLREMLPPSVAQQLKQGLSVDAREYEEATVMFTDVPTFQQIVPLCQPRDIVHLLNELFTKFDRLIGLQRAYKVETVGDSYMSVGGIPDSVLEHCEIKGKGEMNTYFLLRSYKRSIWEIIDRRRDENCNSIDGYHELREGYVDDVINKNTQKNSKTCCIS
ncbi:unnamed protein product [Caenorhabditis sp. 36 PRJEB53466]|nr:unnamed protein product [Caenorhabditis sp. 36 PRJEB53466]